MNSRPVSTVSLVLSAAFLAPAAFALPTQTNVTQSNTPYAISGTDLLQTSGATIVGAGNLTQEGIQGLAALNDGIYGPQGGANAHPPGLGAFSAGSGESVTINFPQANGVTINTLDSFAAWDGARASQNFRFEYQSTVMPGVWHRLASVAHDPGQLPGNTNTRVGLSDSTGTLASNVSAVRMVYGNTNFWGWNGFREVDITGAASSAPAGARFLNSIQINEPFTPSGSDLLQSGGIVTTATGNFQDEGQMGLAALTDGGFGPGGNPGGGGASATGNAGEFITFTLDLVTSPLGYSLSGVDVYAGWDGFRGGMDYSLSYSLVSDPNTFISLGSTSWDANANNAPGGNISTRSMVRDADGELATGVAAVRLSFGDVSFGYAGYREVDVFGTPVPEPSAAATALLAGAALLRRRRRA